MTKQTGQDRLAAAFNDRGRLSDTRRRRLETKAEGIAHPGSAALDELAARVADDPAFWHQLSAGQKLQLGLLQASHGAQHELDGDDPTAA